MLLVNNEPIILGWGDKEIEVEEQLAKDEKMKEIANALKTLAENCNSFTFSGTLGKDEVPISYVKFAHTSIEKAGKIAQKMHKENPEKAKTSMKGAELASVLTNLSLAIESYYNVPAYPLVETSARAVKLVHELKKNQDNLHKIADKMGDVETVEEGIKLLRESLPEAADDVLDNGDNKTLREVAKNLSKRFENATVAISVVRVDKNGELDDDNSDCCLVMQKNLVETAKESGKDASSVIGASTALLAIQILRRLRARMCNELELSEGDGFYSKLITLVGV